MATAKKKKSVATKRHKGKPRARSAKGQKVRAALPLARDSRGRFAKRAPVALHEPESAAGARPAPRARVAPLPSPPRKKGDPSVFKARVEAAFASPQYDVTTGQERAITTHIALRQRAMRETRFVVPSQRVRHVKNEYRSALKKNVRVGLFVNDKNIEEIIYKATRGVEAMQRYKKGKTEPRYLFMMDMSEYGIELFGSDKGEIARVDGLKSEALHWTKDATRAQATPELAEDALRVKLDEYIKRAGRTTVIIETITVTMLYEGKRSGNG